MKNFLKTVITCALLCCLCLSGCGKKELDSKNKEAAGSGEKQNQPTQGEPEERALMPGQIIPEGRNIVTLGIFGKVYDSSPMRKAVDAFNQAQEKYFVQIEVYNDINRFLIDIARKQGTDLYDLYWGVNADDYITKGIFEDLTPWFEGSSAVGRDDIVDAVWRAGSVDDKLYFLIPSFTCNGILVEKGYTREGAWSGKDYLELGKKYPGSMLNSAIQDPSTQILSHLKEYMGAFINWEDRTCSFDGDAFISLLEDLKTLSSYNYEPVERTDTTAELLHGKRYLSDFVLVRMDPGMYSYRDIKDTFGDSYKIAGVPTVDGSLRYSLGYYDQIYGMNAASENKEGAWAFLEYLVSKEYQQPALPNDMAGLYASTLAGDFPVRKDSLEQGLQAFVDYVEDPAEKNVRHMNKYTQEVTGEGYGGFTEEDKQEVLRIIDNSYRQSFGNGHALLAILFEETEPFFQGQKSAEDVANIIQSKVSLYLAE